MFFRAFLFFALVALAFAVPKPEPQVLSYTAPVGYTGYGALPYAYSAYAGYPYYGGYYVR